MRRRAPRTSPPSGPTSTRSGSRYRLEPGLVRGLDYYTRTAFEFYRRGAEGQQSALGGGGRYDGLVELLGGRPTPGIGFGLGLDRVVLALEGAGRAAGRAAGPLAVVVGADPAATGARLARRDRAPGGGPAARAELSTRKLGRQLEAASKDGAHFAVILGDELADGQVQLRDLQAGHPARGRRWPTSSASSSGRPTPTSTADSGRRRAGADRAALRPDGSANWMIPIRLPSLSLNQAARFGPTEAIPSTVLKPGKSYSSNTTPARLAVGHVGLDVVGREPHLGVRTARRPRCPSVTAKRVPSPAWYRTAVGWTLYGTEARACPR